MAKFRASFRIVKCMLHWDEAVARQHSYEFRRELIEMRYPEWQVTRIILVAFLFCLLLACATASGTPGYAIYVPEDSTSARALTDLLHDREHRAVQVSDLKEALESNAGVLVLWLPGRDVSSVDTATLNALRKRRVIAVSYTHLTLPTILLV